MRVLPDKKISASMTVEAAIAIPLFMFAVITIISVMEIMRAYTDIESSLHSSARELALYGAVKDAVIDDYDEDEISEEFLDTVIADGYVYARLLYDYSDEKGSSTIVTKGGISPISLGESYVRDDVMDISFMYQAHPLNDFFSIGKLLLVNRFRFHFWSGYSVGESESENEERTVYITEYGTVYHLTKSCRYLDLTIRPVAGAGIDEERNASGGIYKECEICNPIGDENILYVTDYGSAYHCSLTCSGLKRTIMEVPISSVEGRHSCSGCTQ